MSSAMQLSSPGKIPMRHGGLMVGLQHFFNGQEFQPEIACTLLLQHLLTFGGECAALIQPNINGKSSCPGQPFHHLLVFS